MENAKNPTSIATKWALIYIGTSIVLTYAFQFAGLSETSPIRYIAYVPFVAFLLLAQKEFKDQQGGYLTFGQGFSAGLRYSVFGGLLFGVFLGLYLGVLSPEVFSKTLDTQRAAMEAKGMSDADIENALGIARKAGPIIAAFFGAILVTVFGIVVALVGASLFKKERSPFDNDGGTTFVDPAV